MKKFSFTKSGSLLRYLLAYSAEVVFGYEGWTLKLRMARKLRRAGEQILLSGSATVPMYIGSSF